MHWTLRRYVQYSPYIAPQVKWCIQLPEQEPVAAASDHLPAYSVAVSAGIPPPSRPPVREASLQLTALKNVDSPKSAAQLLHSPQNPISQAWSPTVNR